MLNQIISKLRNAPITLALAVESNLAKHRESLHEFYGTCKDADLYQRVLLCEASIFHYNKKVLEVRRKGFLASKERKTSVYYDFIRQLYPLRRKSEIELSAPENVINWFTNQSKYSRVDHAQLYEAYTKFEDPFAVLTMEEHMDFINRFLFQYSSFQRPNKLSTSTLHGRADTLLAADFNDMLAKRQEYVLHISRILSDLKRHDMELTVDEQNALVYALFFRDLPKIIDRMSRIPGLNVNERYTPFNMSMFEQIKKTMAARLGFVPIDTLNVLLFHAVRHQQDDIIEKIVSDLGIIERSSGVRKSREDGTEENSPLEAKTNSETNIKYEFKNNESVNEVVFQGSPITANDKTFTILLEYFSERQKPWLDVETILPKFLNESGLALSIELVNSLLKVLVSSQPDLARILFMNLFMTEKCKELDPIALDIYKRLLPEQRRAYDNMILVNENIARITGESVPSFQVYPTEQTFYTMLGLTAPNANESMTLLDLMTDEFGLPPSTRIFRKLFQQKWTLSDVVNLAERLIDFHNSNVNLTQDTEHRGSLEFSKQVEHFMDQYNLKKKLDVPSQSWVKLTDALMEDVYIAFLHALEGNLELIEIIGKRRQELTAKVDALRVGYTGSAHNVHQLDEINYVKKAYLMDLVWECMEKE